MMKKLKLLWCSKTKRLRYGLKKEEKKISEVSEFSILPYTQNWKLGNLRYMSLLSNYDSSYNSRFKNDKNINWAKNRKVQIRIKRKNNHFGDFRVFNFDLYPRSKTRKSRKFCFPRILTMVVLKIYKRQRNELRQKLKGSDMI